jgi:hypothetical protein
MKESIVKPDMQTHQSVQRLLPWLVAQTLEGQELAMVQSHVAQCAQCQEDLAWQYQLQGLEPAGACSLDIERALAHMMPRLTPQRSPMHALVRFEWLRSLFKGSGWMPLALASQCAVIAVLAVLLVYRSDDPAPYRVLGASKPAGANMVVVFKPETRELDLRRIMLAYGARVVDGPTVTDAYLLEVPAATLESALSGLHGEPMVVMAASLAKGGAP